MAQPIRRQRTSAERKRSGGGPVAFFIALFIVALGTIQLVSTFHTYALSLAELNGLKRQESTLIAQKRELENDIARWNDKSYVTAQARDRLGFVFPGEVAVHVEHPEAVTGRPTDDADDASSQSRHSTLPWYGELAYAFKKADEPVAHPSGSSNKASTGKASSDKTSSGKASSGKASSEKTSTSK